MEVSSAKIHNSYYQKSFLFSPEKKQSISYKPPSFRNIIVIYKMYSTCCTPLNLNPLKFVKSPKLMRTNRIRIRASKVESHGSPNFGERMERAWLISQQPQPVACSSCDSKGHVECKWCNATGFFVLGDNMLCQIPSKNTTCVICAGKGSACCSDCKGTGYRAKWLTEPPITK